MTSEGITNTSIVDPLISKKFEKKVSDILEKDPDISIIDAVLDTCEYYQIEESAVREIMPDYLKDMVEIEARNLNLLAKRTKGNKTETKSMNIEDI